jgi:hypothetical protein
MVVFEIIIKFEKENVYNRLHDLFVILKFNRNQNLFKCLIKKPDKYQAELSSYRDIY